MNRLYIDSEFNGHGGALLSLAIASPDGNHWYGIMPKVENLDPWIAEHVEPYLWKPEPTVFGDYDLVRASLHKYLLPRSGSIVYADWPDDFAHLMRLMSGPSYEQHWIVDIGMQLLETSDPKPEVPHNALSDAIALMHWHATQ